MVRQLAYGEILFPSNQMGQDRGESSRRSNRSPERVANANQMDTQVQTTISQQGQERGGMEKPPEVPATLNQTGPASHSSVLHTPASIMGPPLHQ